MVYNLGTSSFDFFREEGSGANPRMLYSNSCKDVMDAVLIYLLSTSWIPILLCRFSFLCLTGPGVSCAALGCRCHRFLRGMLK
jgi:hypothetical protein